MTAEGYSFISKIDILFDLSDIMEYAFLLKRLLAQHTAWDVMQKMRFAIIHDVAEKMPVLRHMLLCLQQKGNGESILKREWKGLFCVLSMILAL